MTRRWLPGAAAVTPDLEHENRTIVNLLRDAIDGLIAVYRFGSTVDGRTHQGSDTDVAVLSRIRLSPVARFEIQERVAGRLGRDVDLVDLTAASPVLAILGGGPRTTALRR